MSLSSHIEKCFVPNTTSYATYVFFDEVVNIYILYNDPPLIRSGGSVKKVLYNSVYISTIFSILNYTFIPL